MLAINPDYPIARYPDMQALHQSFNISYADINQLFPYPHYVQGARFLVSFDATNVDLPTPAELFAFL